MKTAAVARRALSLAFGLCLLRICEAQITLNISCRYQGVFHVERNGRYNLLREGAVKLCSALNTSLANTTQMENALTAGFETCRYGWIEGLIAIPRIHPNPICAANNTGIYILVSNITEKYDAYCFNASETRKKVCDQIILPPNYQFPVKIPTDSPSLTDRPDPHETDPAITQQPDEEGSDDRLHDNRPDQGAQDVTDAPQHGHSRPKGHPDESPDPGIYNEATDAPVTGPTHQGHHRDGSSDDTMAGPLPGGSHQSASDTVTKAPLKPGSYTDSDTEITHGSYHSGSDTTVGFHINGDKKDSEESDLPNSVPSNAVTDKYHAGGPHQTTPNAWQPGDKDGSNSGNRVTYTDSMPDATDGHPVSGVDLGFNGVDPTPDGGQESPVHDLETTAEDAGPEFPITRSNEAQPGGGHGPTTASSDHSGQGRGAGRRWNANSNGVGGVDGSSGELETTQGPGFRRHARIPDWLIILVSLVSLALILAVCIAVNSRQTCGHKKKLVINGSGSAALEEGRPVERNGDASKSQEMVNLVSTEQHSDITDQQDELIASDGVQNQQKGDMRIGV